MNTLADMYTQKIERGEITPDADQSRMVALLGDFCAELENKKKPAARTWAFWRGRSSQKQSKSGFYLYGDVGRGKTMVMDLFFAVAPVAKKRRVHFHAFMLEVHDFMHAQRKNLKNKDRIDNDLVLFADKIAAEAQLLCFDEFHVKDVADAMILGRLFTALFDRGVAVIMTSNIEPDRLYEDGLQRDRFLPFIALLKQRLEVVAFHGHTDYRLGRMRDMKTYYWPHDDDAHAEMERIFNAVADGEKPEAVTIHIKDRHIYVPRAAKEIAWFTFAELCETPKSAVDYLALASAYRVFVIEDVPHFDDTRRDVMTRFVTLIDALYDHHAHVVVSAKAPPERLYQGDMPLAFSRTASRLAEMQSRAYRRG